MQEYRYVQDTEGFKNDSVHQRLQFSNYIIHVFYLPRILNLGSK